MTVAKTIISSNRVLAWSGTSQTSITTDDDTIVTNSSGATVWWWQGTGARTSLSNGSPHTFSQTQTTTTYDFAPSSTAAAQITLTVTGKPKK